MNDIKRQYIKEYKQKRKLDNCEYELTVARNYNKICYERKKGLLDEAMFEKYGVLCPTMCTIQEQLRVIKILDRGDFKNELLQMINEIL